MLLINPHSEMKMNKVDKMTECYYYECEDDFEKLHTMTDDYLYSGDEEDNLD
jgi:hypothetical protein